MDETNKDAKTFRDHMLELRSRLIWIGISIVTGSFLGYWQINRVLYFIVHPLHQTLYYTSPTGGLNFTFEIVLLIGIVFSLPIIIYQTLMFFEPVFPKASKYVLKYTFASLFLIILAISFAYFVSLPAVLKFFSDFSSKQVHSLITTDEYFSFVINYLFEFSVLFQFPIVLLLFNKINPLSLMWLFKQEKIVFIGSFLLAAILAPDPFSQIIMATPLIVLYQISILLIWNINRRKEKQQKLDTKS